MSVDDHGLEVLKKSGIDIGTTPKKDYALQTVEVKSSSSSVTNVTASNVAVTVLSANPNRKQAIIYNDSGSIVYLKLGSDPTTTSYSVELKGITIYELPIPVYTGIITAIRATGTSVLRVTELV